MRMYDMTHTARASRSPRRRAPIIDDDDARSSMRAIDIDIEIEIEIEIATYRPSTEDVSYVP